jgi:excisionase family DNA binding protein
LGTDVIELKRTPILGVPKTQGQRYSLLGAQLIRQQTEIAKLYAERLLSVREAAQALGGVTAATVRRYAHTGTLRSVRVGRLGWIRIPVSAVRELLEKGQGGVKHV